jgi:hypothetical protein
MPLTRLIFFPEPRELTDEQYAEALALGHVRGEAPEGDLPALAAGPLAGSGTGTVTSGDDDTVTGPGDDDHTDES